jgi:hypothetical protein
MPGTSAGWVFLPALGSPLAHAPVLRWDLIPALNRPISGRLFGANKTWRGVLMMNAGTVAGAEILYRVPAYRRRLPQAVAASHTRAGMLLGIAIWAGELPNSFIKRRLGIPPGGQRRSPLGIAISLFDQADWVPAASLLLRPVWRMRGREIVEVAAMVTVIHIPINVVGYLIGARTAPI